MAERGEIVVLIAGKFDGKHEGHDDHIVKARKLGHILIAATHRDEIVAKVSKKGFCYRTLNKRVADLYSRPEVSLVVVARDEDGTVAETLRILKPHIFAKGGDRTADNMPQSELDVCKEIGCEIRYGIGDLLNSSSSIAKQTMPENTG